MVKTKGPILGLAASGSLGGSLTFSQSKGVTYAKKKSRPSNPKSQAQTYKRRLWAWLGSRWNKIEMVAPRASWDALATLHDTSPINEFLRENMHTNLSLFGPHTNAGVIGGGTNITMVGTPTVQPLIGKATITDQYVFKHDGWGYMVETLKTSPLPQEQRLLALLPHGTTTKAHVSAQLKIDKGTYNFTFTTFTTQGDLNPIGVQNGVVIP
jgi:hypothetical protein